MKFGVREICEVVLKAKATQKVGNKTFYKGEPVIYFDTLKTSSLEGAATTVYAQGGRGNSRLVAWEGERTLTFTMEDALISPAGFMILSGAGLVDGTEKAIQVHVAETTDGVYVKEDGVYVVVEQAPSKAKEASIYAMLMKDGEIVTEPFIAAVAAEDKIPTDTDGEKVGTNVIFISKEAIDVTFDERPTSAGKYTATDIADIVSGSVVMVDYYTDKTSGAQQIEITPDKFGGNYYLEASTLFRDTNGVDMPAEFIIPNCKIQSNFTFTMASSGDPSTFTFTMDAFPDYTRFDKTKKVLAAIQIISADGEDDDYRISTKA
jgi:hypothetical protein